MEKKSSGSEKADYDNRGSTPEELVKKHMLNRNHIVTESEMQHLKVGDDAENEKEVDEDVSDKEEEIENTPDRQASNSYDILGA